METAPQLLRNDRITVKCALSEPSLTLVQNDSQFGLLISEGVRPNSTGSRLEAVTYLCVECQKWSYTEFEAVAIYESDDLWFAQDLDSGLYFPNPSRAAYHMAFISSGELRVIRAAQAEGISFPVFEIAQRHFGKLPGFKARNRSLESPENYATESSAVSRSAYVIKSPAMR